MAHTHELKTVDFGSLPLVNTHLFGGFLYRVDPKHERCNELFEAAKTLAKERANQGLGYEIRYPYLLNAEDITMAQEQMAQQAAPKVITVDTVVEAYVKTRDTIAELTKKYEEEVAKLKEVQERREAWLRQQLDSVGVDNMKSAHGTIYKMRKESVTVADWDKLFAHICSTRKYEYFHRAVNKKAVLEDMGDNREIPPPPGVSYVAVATVGVRRA